MRYSKSLLLVSTCGLVFLGCAHKSGADLDKFSQNYYTQQHQKADALSKELIAKDKKQRDASLWNLENGVNAFMAGNYKDSLNTLDKANKTFDTNWKNMEKGLAKVGAATFGSATNVPYEGHMYEWTLTNYYMALDYAFMDKFNEARVEFNRTVDRQRRIKEAYAKQIAKVNAEMEKAKKKDGNKAQGMEKSMKGLDQELSKRYSSLEQFKAYDGFINVLTNL
ncbi:lipoprotein [Helicobacter felis]|uniref:Lipoprotein n=1 Tax=Helicobacter felis (strain ATCC 49179 / CCUG 28539 / NCTC 12436 / CS1) TaxID=936155 RepID=E7A8X7_HELFC|nr:lipoprotein [Helicobacter felis]CBY82413.1 lipoprotein [Helicobacter felis ATCC 49179]